MRNIGNVSVQPKPSLSVLMPAVLEDDSLLFEPLNGLPLLVQSLQAYEAISGVAEVVVTLREEILLQVAQLCKYYNISVVRKLICAKQPGISALTAGVYECDREAEFIAIGDPQHPFVTPVLMNRLVKAARISGASAPAVAVQDTIKVVENMQVVSTPKRADLYSLQMPIVVDSALLKASLLKGEGEDDLLSCMEALGLPLSLVKGELENKKIVDAIDFAAAGILMRG